ncbi:MAG TPA: DUF4954 family protein [Chitinophagaceae bacterium]|nr:DUF4954 family protein [Chitinophagaceae bacterium]
MNNIVKSPVARLGYDFIEKKYLPRGKDEYYIRNQQNGEKSYRHLSASEIETLVRNNNTSDDWNIVLVTEAFDAGLVKQCHFYGLVRIGKLEPYYLEFHNLRLPVGLYNSTICSCDFGDNVVVDNVNFMSHYIIGNETIIVNVNEMSVSPHSKFGNGILKEGEDEKVRIWLEICNENGGRKVLPFEGMLPGDAFLWSKYREDEPLLRKFRKFTENKFDPRRGYYGMVGDRSILKNCKIIKDTNIGSDAYLKGANKIKNLTINSSPDATTQIGEGCELVNGIVGYGCRIFYGVKAVRFMMASHSNLKYGARLINSYMGSNATVSCCEVLNSLIFPAHEQHHNNSFLCAALVTGQSNMAAGATIGSNHNSRGADGEIIAGRGFWPGLCVSLKHNSRFATFALVAKGDYPYEINLSFPFSLVINDVSRDKLLIMPGYWFLYNMYALARNSWKHPHRDKRTDRTQYLEYEYLAPDSVEEMFTALETIERITAKAFWDQQKEKATEFSEDELKKKGRSLLLNAAGEVKKLTIRVEGAENSKRPVELLKTDKAYAVFRKMIFFYAMSHVVEGFESKRIRDFSDFRDRSMQARRHGWINVGGQLIDQPAVDALKWDAKNQVLNSWDDIHDRYRQLGEDYPEQKLLHAIASLIDIQEVPHQAIDSVLLGKWIEESVGVSEWMQKQVENSRSKDYKNPFRTMVYDNKKQMENVIGKLSDDSFIAHTRSQTSRYKEIAGRILKSLRSPKPVGNGL